MLRRNLNKVTDYTRNAKKKSEKKKYMDCKRNAELLYCID